MSVQQLRERNNNAQDELRLQRMLEDHRQAAREENQRIYEENQEILYGLMEKYLIENHDLFVKAIEEEDEEDSRYATVFYSLLGGSAFVEFAVENSKVDEETIESIIEDMIDAIGEFDFDDLVDLYHELCNAPVLK